MTGMPFNGAYHYMDWPLTVPKLLMKIALMMNLTAKEASSKCWTLGVAAVITTYFGPPRRTPH